MANGDPIGEIDIVVDADYSRLSDSLQAAVAEAQNGAKQIADAFEIPNTDEALVNAMENISLATSNASAQMSLFGQYSSDALGEVNAQLQLFDTNGIDAVTGGLNSISVAASDSVVPVQQTAAAITDTGNAAQQATPSLEGMAQQLKEIAAGLVITKGLEAFGEEALSAAATIQSVTVGLTALTGSAQQADSIIGQIKTLAETEPFAFPEIAPTVQKMVALGVSATEIPVALQAIADASAATTNSFAAVANMFDRMTLSGMANARTMTTLGISLGDLGNAMGVTAGEASAAFKALDQTGRIDALSAALSQFAGTAVAEAQTVGGKWQIFQNQFEEVMVGVGNALTPAVGDILAFGTSVLNTARGVVDAFNLLPDPIKEIVGALALLVGAAVPVATGLATISFGLQGLNQLIPQATAFWNSLTGAEVANAAASTGVVAANTEIAASTAAVETAVETTATAAIGLGAAVTSLGAIVAGFSWGFLSANAEVSVTDQLNAMTGYAHSLGVSLSFMTDASGSASGAINKLTGILATSGVDISALNDKFNSGAITQQQYVLALLETVKGQVGLQAATDGTSASYSKFLAEQQKLTDAAAAANNNLKQAKIDLDNGTISSTTYAAAQAALTKAQDALTNSSKLHSTATAQEKLSVDGVTQAANKLVAEYDQAIATTNALVAADGKSLQAKVALALAIQNQDALTKKLHDSQAQQKDDADAVSTATQAIYDKTTAANAALIIAEQVYHDIAQATRDGADDEQAYVLAVDALVKSYQAANPQLVGAKNNIGDVRAAAIAAADAETGLTHSHDGLITVIRNGESSVANVPSSFNSMGTTAGGAAPHISDLAASHGKLINTASTGHGALSQAATDMQAMGLRAIDADTPIGKLGDGVSHIVTVVDDGAGSLGTAVETFGKMGTNADGSVKPLTDMGISVGTIGVKIQDSDGERIQFVQDIQNAGIAAKETHDPLNNYADDVYAAIHASDDASTSVDIFDTSMIKVSRDAVTASDGASGFGKVMTTNYGDSTGWVQANDNLAKSYEDIANAAYDAAVAAGNFDSAQSGASAAGGKGSKKNPTDSSLFQGLQSNSAYARGTTPAEMQAIQEFLAYNGTGSASLFGQFTNFMQTGGLYEGQPGYQNTPTQQGLGPTGQGGGPIFGAAAVSGGTLDASGNLVKNTPPVYGAGSGVAGTPMVLVSTDGGATWQDAGYGDYPTSGGGVPTAASGLAQQLADAATAIGAAAESTQSIQNAAATLSQQLSSTGQFLSYTPAPQGGPTTPFSAATEVYAIGANGVLLVSTDGGKTWLPSSGSSGTVGVALSPGPGLNSYLAPTTGAPSGTTTATTTATTTSGTVTGPVWSGPTSDPGTGVTGSPKYTITGSGTASDPYKWAPSGQTYAGVSTSSAQDLSVYQQATQGSNGGPVWSGSISNPDTGITGSPKYMVTGSGTTQDPYKWIPTTQTNEGTTNTPATIYQNAPMDLLQPMFDLAANFGHMPPIGPQNDFAANLGTSSGQYGYQNNPGTLSLDQTEALWAAQNPFNQGASANDAQTQLAQLVQLQKENTALGPNSPITAAQATTLNTEISQLTAALKVTYTPQTQTNSASQLAALLGQSSTVPGSFGNGQPVINITINNPQVPSTAAANQLGTTLVNTLRQANNQLRYI